MEFQRGMRAFLLWSSMISFTLKLVLQYVAPRLLPCASDEIDYRFFQLWGMVSGVFRHNYTSQLSLLDGCWFCNYPVQEMFRENVDPVLKCLMISTVFQWFRVIRLMTVFVSCGLCGIAGRAITLPSLCTLNSFFYWLPQTLGSLVSFPKLCGFFWIALPKPLNGICPIKLLILGSFLNFSPKP